MLANLCAGLIMPMPNVEDGYLGELERRQLPCVFVNFDARAMALPVVVVENRNGARLAVEHLLSLGHRRIAFIAGSHHTGQSAERQAAYVEALNHAGIAADPALIVPGRFVQTGGFAATQQLLALADPPTAIFAGNDRQAAGVYRALHERDISVPQAISVIGFDNLPYTELMNPPLTTVHAPRLELGRTAAAMLLRLINGETLEMTRVVLPTEFVERHSCQSPRP